VLKSVRLKNFKLHEDTLIEAAPITVFIGPNNSGKSSIFQALLLLRQASLRNDQYLCQPSAGYQLRGPEPFQYSPQVTVDLGEFEEVLQSGTNEAQFDFSGRVKVPQNPFIFGEVEVAARLIIKENRLVFHSGSLEAAGKKTSWEFLQGTTPRTVYLDAAGMRFGLRPEATFRLIVAGGYGPSGEITPEAAVKLNELSNWLGGVTIHLLRSVHPIFPLRGFEEWGYPITEQSPGTLEFMTLHDRALALPNALASDRRLKSTLSARLEEIFGISIDFETVRGKRLKIWARHGGNASRDTLFINEGTGASQIPFILVPLLLTPSSETVMVTEPEVHLHPEAQSKITSMLLSVAKKENIQLLIETHSEHVLHKLLHAVGKGELAREELALYYFENKNGTAKVRRLDVNDKGQVDGGLPGFFDQSLAELTEYLDALRKP
jgi:energy-coupling factor transporter ATP-binding protein EcfA2